MNKRLIIRISRHSLSFSTSEEGQVVYEPYALKSSISIAANMREALRTHPLLQDDYERTTVLADAPVMLTPTTLFSESSQAALYRYTFAQQEPQLVMNHVLTDLNAVAVFAIQKDLHLVISERFGNVRTMPVAVPVWRHLYQKSFTGQAQKLYGYFHDQRLEVFAFGQNRFKFHNAFAAPQANDALYYLLSVWKQLGLEAREDELHLSGDLPERETLIDEARRFVKRVLVSNPSGEFNRAQVTRIAGMPYDLMVYYLKGI